MPSPKGTINIAWLIAFAPIENPEIAFAVAIEGDTPGEETGGGRYASPVVHAILKTYLEKKNRPAAAQPLRFKTE
jgi:penicillin-binding protein 2